MSKTFGFGMVVGMGIIIAYSYLFPRHIVPVNEELIRCNMAYYNNEGEIIWKTKGNDK